MKISEQLKHAKEMGKAAFANGVKCAPCLDSEFMKLISGRSPGQKTKGQASSVKLMKSWQDGWTNENFK